MKIRRLVLKLPQSRTAGAVQFARQTGEAIAQALPASAASQTVPSVTVQGDAGPGPILARRIAAAVARRSGGKAGG